MKKQLCIAFLAASLTACAVGGVGHSFTFEQVQQVKPGMTVQQVTEILGQPQSTTMTSGGTVMSWVYVPPTTISPIPMGGSKPIQTRTASIVFKNGVVAEDPK